MDAGFIHQVYDHLHLVIALEVCQLWRITSVNQRLEASLYQLYQAAAENCLLTKEVLFGFLSKSCLDNTGASTTNTPAVGQSDIPSIAGCILSNASQIRYTRTFGVLTTNNVARTLRCTHDYVNAFRSFDVTIVNVETMSESKSIAVLQMRSNMCFIYFRLLLVGNEDHNKVCFFSSIVHVHYLQASFFSLCPRGRTLAKTNANINARILKVQRMSMTLRAIANNGYLHALDY